MSKAQAQSDVDRLDGEQPLHSGVHTLPPGPRGQGQQKPTRPPNELVRSVPGIVFALGLLYLLIAYGVPMLLRIWRG